MILICLPLAKLSVSKHTRGNHMYINHTLSGKSIPLRIYENRLVGERCKALCHISTVYTYAYILVHMYIYYIALLEIAL